MFTVLLKDLKGATEYSFRITEVNWDNSRAQIYTYKTFDSKNMTIIDGGDIGLTQIAYQMTENTVAELEADLFMIGGDVAYDQNNPNCFRAYDYLMRDLIPMQKLNKNTNTIRIIPMMFSMGNHDLGMNAYSGWSLKHTESEPVIKHYYPQNTFNNSVPDVHHRTPYFAQSIGKFLWDFEAA